jgi:hypothetical protein
MSFAEQPVAGDVGGGNESSGVFGSPYGEAIDMMGRLSIELDGTRPFHRGEPFEGIRWKGQEQAGPIVPVHFTIK